MLLAENMWTYTYEPTHVNLHIRTYTYEPTHVLGEEVNIRGLLYGLKKFPICVLNRKLQAIQIIG
jgi:hypothetical protein